VSQAPQITIYTTIWCTYCQALKRKLDEAEITYCEVDIEDNPECAGIIERFTGGYRTVPTVEVCGSYLVNPSLDEIIDALKRCASYA